MSLKYRAIINEDEEIDITESDLNSLDAGQLSDTTFHVVRNKRSYIIKLLKHDPATKTLELLVNGEPVEVTLRDGVEVMIHDMGLDVVEDGFAQELHAPMPGLVLSIDVTEGQQVSKSDALVILEAMKMENVLSAPADVEIAKIHIEPGQAVEKGQLLVTFA